MAVRLETKGFPREDKVCRMSICPASTHTCLTIQSCADGTTPRKPKAVLDEAALLELEQPVAVMGAVAAMNENAGSRSHTVCTG